MERLSLPPSLKKHPKWSNKEIGFVYSYANLWVRDHPFHLTSINAELIHRTVDLKYVLSTQVVQIQYESRTRFFSVAAVKARTRNAIHPEQNISESLGALSVHDPTHIYMVDWDTSITIEDNLQVSEPKPQTVKKFSSLHVFCSI